MPRTPLTGLLLLVATGIAAAADQPSPQGLDFFERKIRTVLVKAFYECHSVAAERGDSLRGLT